MTAKRITKRTVDSLQANGGEYTLWDDTVNGFGVRVRPTGAKSYVVVYRAGAGRGARVRRYTISAVGKITPERARAQAKIILGAVAHGDDPASQKTTERGTPTVAELADRFMADYVRAKRKAGTAEFYRDILDRIVKPALGTAKSDKLTRLQVSRRAWLFIPARQQERPEDRHPQRPCPCGPECAGAGWSLRGAWRRSAAATPRSEAPVGCRRHTRRSCRREAA